MQRLIKKEEFMILERKYVLFWQWSVSFNEYVTQNINAISMVIPTFWDSIMSLLLSISIKVSFSSQISC